MNSQLNYSSWQQNVYEADGNMLKPGNNQPLSDLNAEQSQYYGANKCFALSQTQTDITTLDEYGKFDFQVKRKYVFCVILLEGRSCERPYCNNKKLLYMYV